MQNRSKILTAAAAALLLAIPGAVDAQESTTRGWLLGFNFHSTSLTVESGDANYGGGGGLHFGYGFNRRWAIIGGFDGAVVDVEDGDEFIGEWTMGHGDLGIRFSFANSLSRWIPYLQATGGARTVTVEETEFDGEVVDIDFDGPIFTLGGGLGFYLNQTLSLDMALKFTGGQFDALNIGSVTIRDLDIEAQSFRFALGLSWWP